MLDQLFPLKRSATSGELFLRLPAPHDNLILTPPRPDDALALVGIINDPEVYPWLGRPAEEYTLSDAKALVEEYTASSNEVIEKLENTVDLEGLVFAEDCPVRSIREMQTDGTDVFIGNITIKRCNWWDVQAPERERLKEANAALPTGHPEIVWQLSDFLASSHHRRGIMSVVIQTLMTEWAIPRMGVRQMHVSAFIGNTGSVRVFEKNGFVLTTTLQDAIEIRGERRGLHVLDWTYTHSEC
ncbi:N-acetyltransferase domain-containing protein [Mycena indigotica]|uniref:N-acetyltransferase domain-containing protein n=1 Tax=Mycena indigotica TaxID=2126181 RepID=A0A8H6WDR5_9AGAR|nr:N-acetyltransferase domain-containing protein [Mycena indigotica]KAF7314954.1 N-acetyltransferase domain-containing protein [Mycena indigotica]